MADGRHKPGSFRLRRIRRDQAEEDAPGMRARKYVAMGVVVLSAVAVAIGVGWFIYTGRDPKISRGATVLAYPFAFALGTTIGVGGCLLIRSRRPHTRLRYSLLFVLLAAFWFWWIIWL